MSEHEESNLAVIAGKRIRKSLHEDKGWVQIVHALSIPTEGGSQPMLCARPVGSRP